MASSMFDLSGKVSLVTGGTKGLGYGMVKALAEAGSDIVVVSRTAPDCERVAEEVRAMGRRALAAPTDISKLESIEGLVEKAVQEFGRIDVLVNNAGTAVTKSAIDITEEDWDWVQNLNLRGVFFLSQAVGKQMIKQNGGKIITVASIMGLVADVSIIPYVASKGGLIQMSKALALEWARYNINVNVVAPGYVITPMNEKEFSNPKIYERMLKKIPMRRLGTVEDIAGAVVYFASDASNYCTGSVLVVDGGWIVP